MLFIKCVFFLKFSLDKRKIPSSFNTVTEVIYFLNFHARIEIVVYILAPSIQSFICVFNLKFHAINSMEFKKK